MPTNDETAAPVGQATVRHQPGAVRMDEYPLLIYGPASDPAVRVASKGLSSASVPEIVAFHERNPNLPGGGLKALFDLSDPEWDEIVRWSEDPNAPGRE